MSGSASAATLEGRLEELGVLRSFSRPRVSNDNPYSEALLSGALGPHSARLLRQLLPMGFRDFLAATRPDLPLPQRCHPARLMDPLVAEDLQSLAYGVDDDDLAWPNYLGCGGFRERWLSTNERAPSVAFINATCWPRGRLWLHDTDRIEVGR